MISGFPAWVSGRKALRLLVMAVVALAALGSGVPAASGRRGLSGRVIVPQVSGGAVGVYARLHAAGLKVSIPAGVSLGPLASRTRWRVSPRSGSRVLRGSVVVLSASCCGGVGRALTPAGRLPSYVVPSFVGLSVGAAYGWVGKKRLFFVARLGRLRAGDGPSLFENYRVVGQRPAAGKALTLGIRTASRGGRRRRFRATPLTVYGVQGPPTPCTPPVGRKVVAKGSEAVITEQLTGHGDGALVAWYGCLRAVGQQRLLASARDTIYSGGSSLLRALVAGRFAALQFDDFGGKYDTSSGGTRIEAFNLTTGMRQHAFTARFLGPPDYLTFPGVDSLQLNSSGFLAWRATSGLPDSARPALNDISCPSASECVAADSKGAVTATNPTGGRGAWTFTNIDPSQPSGITGVSCPSTVFCAAVEPGAVFTSSAPTDGYSLLTRTQLPPIPVNHISCPSTSLCVAYGNSSSIVTSTDPTASPSTWTAAVIDPGSELTALSCPSVSLCVAGDPNGNVLTSTNPTGGSSAWTLAHIPGLQFGFSSISCPSTSLCVAANPAGDVVTSTNPVGGAGAWTVAHVEDPKSAPLESTGLSCPSVSLCVAVYGSGDVVTSTNPSGGPGAWQRTALGGAPQMTAVSCPLSSLCVAIDNAGHVITSTNPTGGASAWTRALIDGPDCALTTPCLTEKLYAHDSQGTRTIDSTPPGSGDALTNVVLAGNELTWTVNGGSRQVTLR